MNVHPSNLSIVDEWNLKSVETISLLQSKLLPYEWWIIQCSHLGDNRQAFTFFFPLIAGCLNILGVRVLWAAILAEWSNLILKWIFKGDRPYWWVMQTSIFSDSGRPSLRQFQNTCETGPGTPSGHIMMNVALFYVVARGISKHYIWTSRKYKCTKILLSSLLYSAYAAWVGIIFTSRLYIQAHFIHQCVFGVIFGLVIGHYAWGSKWITKPHLFGSMVFANFLVGSALLFYGFLLRSGLNPLWAVSLAIKYCEKSEYVSLDTQPYYIMVRFTALALGVGCAIAFKNRRYTSFTNRSSLRTILTITVGLLMGKLLSMSHPFIPQDDLIVYLSINFVILLLFPSIILSFVPYSVNILFGK